MVLVKMSRFADRILRAFISGYRSDYVQPAYNWHMAVSAVTMFWTFRLTHLNQQSILTALIFCPVTAIN
jgi:hypothetical protein